MYSNHNESGNPNIYFKFWCVFMKVKKILFFVALPLCFAIMLSACKKSEGAEMNKVSASSISKASSSAELTSFDSSKSFQNASGAVSGESKAESTNAAENSTNVDSKTTFESADYKAETDSKARTAINSKLELLSFGSSNGVMCAEIKNVSESDIEYCLLTATAKGKTAEFSVSVLPKGETAIVFEKDEKKFDNAFSNAVWKTENEILFEEPLDIMTGVFEVHCSNGSLEIKNISKEDVDKTIIVCYKTVISERLCGSVSFRMKLDGIKRGETKQLFSDNIGENSRVIYIKYGS